MSPSFQLTQRVLTMRLPTLHILSTAVLALWAMIVSSPVLASDWVVIERIADSPFGALLVEQQVDPGYGASHALRVRIASTGQITPLATLDFAVSKADKPFKILFACTAEPVRGMGLQKLLYRPAFGTQLAINRSLGLADSFVLNSTWAETNADEWFAKREFLRTPAGRLYDDAAKFHGLSIYEKSVTAGNFGMWDVTTKIGPRPRIPLPMVGDPVPPPVEPLWRIQGNGPSANPLSRTYLGMGKKALGVAGKVVNVAGKCATVAGPAIALDGAMDSMQYVAKLKEQDAMRARGEPVSPFHDVRILAPEDRRYGIFFHLEDVGLSTPPKSLLGQAIYNGDIEREQTGLWAGIAGIVGW